MSFQGPTTAAWFERAKGSLVNGVSSQFRYWGDDDTLVIDRGEGTYVWDMDGRRYLDYQLGFGPIILGHGHPTVVAAVQEAAADGTTFAMTSRREVEAAERFTAALPWVDSFRFTNTGTEATMHAIRLARAHTGRDLVLKFEGQYHGVHDYVLYTTAGSPAHALGSRQRPVPWQSSSGIPDGIRDYIRVLPFNDLELVERTFRDAGHLLAAVIVEPMLGNVFGLEPEPDFLPGLRSLCDEHGSLLIFDEVKTGFRLGLGGAQAHFGVTPDLATYAKAMGNGFPVAAIAGLSGPMDAWRGGGIAQAGTYSGNGVAAAAAAATLDELRDGDHYERINKAGTALMDGLRAVCADASVPVTVTGHPAMFSLFLSDQPVREFRDSTHHDADLYGSVVAGMIRRGVMPCPDALEPWFTCSALTDDDVATTLSVFEESLGEALGR